MKGAAAPFFNIGDDLFERIEHRACLDMAERRLVGAVVNAVVGGEGGRGGVGGRFAADTEGGLDGRIDVDRGDVGQAPGC